MPLSPARDPKCPDCDAPCTDQHGPSGSVVFCTACGWRRELNHGHYEMALREQRDIQAGISREVMKVALAEWATSPFNPKSSTYQDPFGPGRLSYG